MTQESTREEIKWLESQLEQKKRELAKKGVEQKEEREVIKEVLREIPEEKMQITTPSPVISDDAAQKTALELREKEHEEIIDSLINLTFTKNLTSAVKVAESMKNPHILDEFHDALADHYYQKLLEARKIKE